MKYNSDFCVLQHITYIGIQLNHSLLTTACKNKIHSILIFVCVHFVKYLLTLFLVV